MRLANGKITVTDGPFTESKEVIGGWAILKADSKAEAIRVADRVHGAAPQALARIRGRVARCGRCSSPAWARRLERTTSTTRSRDHASDGVRDQADQDSEAGVMPSQELIAKMMKFNEELVKAGVMLAGDGLHADVEGQARALLGLQRTVIDGPFAETKELVAGYWIWQVKSMEEAVEWLKRAPFDGGVEVTIRPVFEAEDFGKELTPELRAKEERLRAEVERQRQS